MDKQTEWDIYFMKIAKQVATRSKCLSRQIGSVLVKDNRIIATGYNGPAPKVKHCDYRDDSGKYKDEWQSNICPRKRMGFKSGEFLEHCPAVHAEMNAVLQTTRMSVDATGSTLYCSCPTPCSDCSKEIIGAGIKRVVCLELRESRPWSSISSKEMFEMADVKLDVVGEELINGQC